MPSLVTAVLVGLAVSQAALFMTTVFLHRNLSHKAITLSPAATMAFRVMTWITTGILPRQWVAVHRKHHAFTDVEGDPHSPLLEGFWKVQLGNVFLYRKAAHDELLVARYAKDLPRDKWDKYLFDRPLIGLAIGVAALVGLLGWEMALVAAAVHTVVYLLVNSAVNAIGHAFGKQPNDNLARNNQWLAWLAAGEGLHNNHHAAPTSAKLAFDKGQLDPGWWVIRTLVAAGLAKVRHERPHFRQPASEAVA
ncbi:MAG: fatty acid desaturase [Actinomycetota bacterium]|nr:fatty acid desaturase [Actinomycetota bacterium]